MNRYHLQIESRSDRGESGYCRQYRTDSKLNGRCASVEYRVSESAKERQGTPRQQRGAPMPKSLSQNLGAGDWDCRN